MYFNLLPRTRQIRSFIEKMNMFRSCSGGHFNIGDTILA